MYSIKNFYLRLTKYNRRILRSYGKHVYLGAVKTQKYNKNSEKRVD